MILVPAVAANRSNYAMVKEVKIQASEDTSIHGINSFDIIN
jgi:hypothetical protein